MKTKLLRRVVSILLVLCLCSPLVTEHVSAKDVKKVVAPTKEEGASDEVQTEKESKSASKRTQIVEKTENSTTYLLEDGGKEVVLYSGEVRYPDKTGEWIDYEPELVEITKEEKAKDKKLEGYEYQNKSGDTKHYLPENLTQETPVLLKKDGYEIQVRPIFAEETLEAVPLEEEEVVKEDAAKDVPDIEEVIQEVDTKSLPVETEMDTVEVSSESHVDLYDQKETIPLKTVYSNEEKQMDLEYTSQETGIKENIILKEKPDSNVFLYQLELKDIFPRKNPLDGGITFYDKKTEDIVGNIPAPFMNDASGEAYSEDLTYSIGQKEGEEDVYILGLTVNEEYLHSSDRVYPVTIDPTITWTGSTDIADVYVLSNGSYRTTNFYSSGVTTFSVGDGAQGLYRTYLRFANYLTKLGGYYVDSARLTVYETGNGESGTTVQAHRVTEDWSKTSINWENRAGYNTTKLTSFVTTGKQGTSRTMDITDYTRGVANGTYTSYGIMLRDADESSSGKYSQYYSSRHSSVSLRPKLSVLYYDGPTAASSVAFSNAYMKPGAAATINWEGIVSPSLNRVEYRLIGYHCGTGEFAAASNPFYSAETKIGTTKSGSKKIAQSVNWKEGCYRLYVRGVDNGGIKGVGKGATLHIDGTIPTLSSAKVTPVTTPEEASDAVPKLTWSGGEDAHFSKVEYSINGGAYASAGTAKAGTITLPAASFTEAGAYTVRVRAVDKAGNYSKVKTLTYYYDKNAKYKTPIIERVVMTKEQNPKLVIFSNFEAAQSPAYEGVYYAIVSSDTQEEPTEDQYVKAKTVTYTDQKTEVTFASGDLPTSEGIYKIYSKIKNTAGNISEPVSVGYYNFLKAEYDGNLVLTGWYEEQEEKIKLEWAQEENLASVDLYARATGGEFVKSQTLTGTTVSMPVEHIEESVDYRILVTYTDGSQKLSNIETISRFVEEEESQGSEGTEIVEFISYGPDYLDGDEDGLEDGYELWDFGSHPQASDSDGDGFDDYYEVETLGTAPSVYNKNEDSDGDGLNNLVEYEKGTQPYLADSDLDGMTDKEDAEPFKTSTITKEVTSYSFTVPKGLYDKVERETVNGVTSECLYNLYTEQVKEISCDSGDKTSYFYDKNGNNTVVLSYADGKYVNNTYTYEEDQLAFVYHNGFGYDFIYGEDQLTGVRVGNQNLLLYGYDEDGKLIKIQYGNGQKEEKVYSGDLLTGVKVNGKLSYEMAYDAEGKVTSLTDSVNKVSYSYGYNEEGKLETITGDNGFSIRYQTEDIQNENEETTTSNTTTTYQDQGVERVLQSESVLNEGINTETNTTILISGEKFVSEVKANEECTTTSNRVMNASGKEILKQSITEDENKAQIVNQTGDTLTCGYDEKGNIGKISGNGSELVSYQYDGLGQLIRENDKEANKSVVYAYDQGGNILSRKEYPYTTGTLGSVSEEKKYQYGNTIWKDLMTSYDGQAITYDEMGNPLQYRDGIKFTWDNGRTLATYQSKDYNISYKYNMDGLRTEKTVNGAVTTYYYDDTQLIKEVTGKDTIWYLYDGSGSLTGFELNGQAYYYEKNLQEDIIGIYDEEGKEVVSYSFNAWGKVIKVSGDQVLGEKNPFRYRGYYYDVETGFYYVGSRYYDPSTGRFLNADEPTFMALNGKHPIGANLYAYCYNNPVNMVDESGELPHSIKLLAAKVGLKATCRLQYKWIYATPTTTAIATYRINKAISTITKYKKTIKSVASKYGVPATIIAGIILKEMYTQSIPDGVANLDTFIRGSKHSTGLGAIFPSAARDAWEFVGKKYKLPKLPNDNKNLQYKLSSDNKFNIEAIAIVLIHKAHVAKCISSAEKSSKLSMAQWKKAVATYNGRSSYANKVWEYLKYLKIILK